MSAREVHVRIGRLVVDAPLGGEADGWAAAIGRALRQRLAGAAAGDGTRAEEAVPEAIAQHVATRIGVTNQDGGDHEHV
jgi:hypothetical protein